MACLRRSPASFSEDERAWHWSQTGCTVQNISLDLLLRFSGHNKVDFLLMCVGNITIDPPTRSDQNGQNKDQNQQRAEVKSWCRIKGHDSEATTFTSTFGGRSRRFLCPRRFLYCRPSLPRRCYDPGPTFGAHPIFLAPPPSVRFWRLTAAIKHCPNGADLIVNVRPLRF
jgi:hypothetical protein